MERIVQGVKKPDEKQRFHEKLLLIRSRSFQGTVNFENGKIKVNHRQNCDGKFEVSENNELIYVKSCNMRCNTT